MVAELVGITDATGRPGMVTTVVVLRREAPKPLGRVLLQARRQPI